MKVVRVLDVLNTGITNRTSHLFAGSGNRCRVSTGESHTGGWCAWRSGGRRFQIFEFLFCDEMRVNGSDTILQPWMGCHQCAELKALGNTHMTHVFSMRADEARASPSFYLP